MKTISEWRGPFHAARRPGTTEWQIVNARGAVERTGFRDSSAAKRIAELMNGALAEDYPGQFISAPGDSDPPARPDHDTRDREGYDDDPIP